VSAALSQEASDHRLPVLAGREQAAPLSAKVDVVVIGSGAGGAVVARELARDGRSVLVLEEGGHYAPEEYGAMTPSHSFRRLAREAGMSVALGIGDTPLISLLAGKCVGGSSVLTGAVCFRIPEEVLYEWSTDLGLARMTA
jgi:choline dehydrogenase-like flavoprotein